MTYWTTEVTESIQKGLVHMNQYLDKSNYQILKVVDLVRGKLSTQNRITLCKALSRTHKKF